VAKIILLPLYAINIAFFIIIDMFMAYKFPICDVFHLFCKIARFYATEPKLAPNFDELFFIENWNEPKKHINI
jgi:hypothetical protein